MIMEYLFNFNDFVPNLLLTYFQIIFKGSPIYHLEYTYNQPSHKLTLSFFEPINILNFISHKLYVSKAHKQKECISIIKQFSSNYSSKSTNIEKQLLNTQQTNILWIQIIKLHAYRKGNFMLYKMQKVEDKYLYLFHKRIWLSESC